MLCGVLLDRYFGPYVAISFVILPAVGLLTLLGGADPRSRRSGLCLSASAWARKSKRVDIAKLRGRIFSCLSCAAVWRYGLAARQHAAAAMRRNPVRPTNAISAGR